MIRDLYFIWKVDNIPRCTQLNAFSRSIKDIFDHLLYYWNNKFIIFLNFSQPLWKEQFCHFRKFRVYSIIKIPLHETLNICFSKIVKLQQNCRAFIILDFSSGCLRNSTRMLIYNFLINVRLKYINKSAEFWKSQHFQNCTVLHYYVHLLK